MLLEFGALLIVTTTHFREIGVSSDREQLVQG
jgi:hypothetical protein